MTPREPTETDRIAEDWVDAMVELDPDVAIWLGVPGRLTEFADHSPAGIEAYDDAVRIVIARLEASTPVDETDRITRTDMLSELRLELEQTEAGLPFRDLNVIASPAQDIRDSFDLMPTDTEEDWATIAGRMANVPGAILGYIETLREGIRRGIVPARRQVAEVARQARSHGDPLGFFFDFVDAARLADGRELPMSLVADLHASAGQAATGYDILTNFLEGELAPVATEHDGVGRELYALQSRHFLGTEIDLDESYEWGLEELARTVAEQERAAGVIVPGGTVAEAIAALERDETRLLHGTEALREWMQELADRALDALAGSHFDIPEPVRRLECLIAPTQTGGIYYTGPSDDFSRPGRMWWSVPDGVHDFATWRETTTVYHEGVPGHHLQIGQAVYNSAQLNTWRRHFGGVSGHSEGWALYAERLMAELGFLADPADTLGMLDGQRMRAARVVIDIGVHTGKRRPDGEGRWDGDYALRFLKQNVSMDDAFVRYEVNRYLGWPGQAPSYKIGQRVWEELRDDARRRAGSEWNIRDWHRRALDIGGVGLDTLRSVLA